MQAIQSALNRDLLLEREKGKLYWAFDVKELLKGDMRERFEAYRTALDSNFMQIDEVRYAEDLEPLGLSWIKRGPGSYTHLDVYKRQRRDRGYPRLGDGSQISRLER